jgi:hypothetical protein
LMSEKKARPYVPTRRKYNTGKRIFRISIIDAVTSKK